LNVHPQDLNFKFEQRVSFSNFISSTNGPFRTLTGHRMPRCSFPEADINWSSKFSIRKQLSMRSCTTRTLHVSHPIAIPGYAAQVSVRAGSVIAHLVSLNRDGPKPTLTE
jgi:hypothetical protein